MPCQKNKIGQVLLDTKVLLEGKGHTVAYIGLYGSQNYGLDIYSDDYQSDIDIKAIIVPSLDDLVYNSKPVSKKIIIPTGECDVKDIRIFVETLMKANPAYLETLFTDYFIINPQFQLEIEQIRDKREELVKELSVRMAKSCYGMILEKRKALCHRYPSTAWKIDKYGADGKQLSHALRLFDILHRYFFEDTLYKACLYPEENNLQRMLDTKLQKYDLDTMQHEMENTVVAAKALVDMITIRVDIEQFSHQIQDEYLELTQKIIKDKIVKEILN